jgi:hypothetical protein
MRANDTKTGSQKQEESPWQQGGEVSTLRIPAHQLKAAVGQKRLINARVLWRWDVGDQRYVVLGSRNECLARRQAVLTLIFSLTEIPESSPSHQRTVSGGPLLGRGIGLVNIIFDPHRATVCVLAIEHCVSVLLSNKNEFVSRPDDERKRRSNSTLKVCH